MSRFSRSGGKPGWAPFLYLFYIGFVFVQPIANHAGRLQWFLALASVAVFLPLYFAVWRGGRGAVWCLVTIAALGFAYYPFNGGGSAYLIYAAALFGFLFRPRLAFACLGALLAGIATESLLLHLPVFFWVPAMALTAFIGAANIYAGNEKRADAKLRLAHDEIQHLAKVAERERIARDMHDVLGHTLSVIILKSELASKLLDRDTVRARGEIAEIEQIAREALAEVRHAIRGYRAGSLTEEFARARSTLETAGIHADCEAREIRPGANQFSPAQETVLALVVREAVTNVVRHSGAANCRILFTQETDCYRLQISDDGHGSSNYEGNGLRGMRERVEALDGSITRDSSHGTHLIVILPIGHKQEAIA